MAQLKNLVNSYQIIYIQLLETEGQNYLVEKDKELVLLEHYTKTQYMVLDEATSSLDHGQ